MDSNFWKSVLLPENKDVYLSTIKKINEEINAFVSFDSHAKNLQRAREKYYNPSSKSILDGIPFSHKSNIALEESPLTCASALLRDFIAPNTATMMKQLLEAGSIPLGVTNMDEFGMGSDTTNSIFGPTKNPWNIAYTAGGSSGGAAATVAAGLVPYGLGSDTGGSVRQPASFCGLWGMKPTYGAVSRYGLVAFASSLDVIGVIAEHPSWLEPVFETIKVRGKDIHDASSFYPDKVPSSETKKLAIVIPSIADIFLKESLRHAKSQYESAGYEVETINLDIFDYSAAVYFNIAAAEASANLARFDGIRYGNRGGFADSRLELIRNARNKGFGQEVKTRILTGTFVLRSGFQDQFYIKAQKAQQHIRKTINSLFQSYDLVVIPCTPGTAFKLFDENMTPFQQKLADAYSVVANLAGIPAVSYPVGFKDGLPMGLQVLAPHYAEKRIFNFINDSYKLFDHRISPYAKQMYEATGREGTGLV